MSKEKAPKVFFQFELTDGQIERKMVLENVDPNRAVAILVQASEATAKDIYANAQLKQTSEKGNN